jgi:hypothetical protein
MTEHSINRPPFDDLKSLIEMAGYEVISIGAEHSGFRNWGAINLQIAPRDWIENTDFVSFSPLPKDLISSLRECAAQSPQQEKGNCQE